MLICECVYRMKQNLLWNTIWQVHRGGAGELIQAVRYIYLRLNFWDVNETKNFQLLLKAFRIIKNGDIVQY